MEEPAAKKRGPSLPSLPPPPPFFPASLPTFSFSPLLPSAAAAAAAGVDETPMMGRGNLASFTPGQSALYLGQAVTINKIVDSLSQILSVTNPATRESFDVHISHLSGLTALPSRRLGRDGSDLEAPPLMAPLDPFPTLATPRAVAGPAAEAAVSSKLTYAADAATSTPDALKFKFQLLVQDNAPGSDTERLPPSRCLVTVTSQTQPPSKEALENLAVLPLVAVGEIFQVTLRTVVPAEKYLTSAVTNAFGQVAVARVVHFPAPPDQPRPEFAMVVLGFQIFYHDRVSNKDLCLRCKEELPACSCTYPSDLLEILHDTKSRPPAIQLSASNPAELSIRLRIPRLRRKLTLEEIDQKCVLEKLRPSDWNRKLPVDPDTKTKTVLIRVIELGFPDASQTTHATPPVVLSRTQGYARLVGKSYTITQARLDETMENAVTEDGESGAVFEMSNAGEGDQDDD